MIREVVNLLMFIGSCCFALYVIISPEGFTSEHISFAVGVFISSLFNFILNFPEGQPKR